MRFSLIQSGVLPTGEYTAAGERNLMGGPNISLVLLGGVQYHTECGSKWSPESVDEFNRTAEKYCGDGSRIRIDN